MGNAAIHHVTAIRRLHAEHALRSFGVVLEVESAEAAAKVLNDAFGLTSARRDHDRTVLLPPAASLAAPRSWPRCRHCLTARLAEKILPCLASLTVTHSLLIATRGNLLRTPTLAAHCPTHYIFR
jgi:hypothetical protein